MLTSQFLHPFIFNILLHSTLVNHPQSHTQSLIVTRNCSTYEITESNIPLSDMISFLYGLFAQVASLQLFCKLNEEPLALPVFSFLPVCLRFQVRY